MSDAILDVFKRRDAARENDYVFPGQGGIGHIVELKRAVQAVTKKSKVKFCLHELRRTFSGIAEQEVSYAMLKRLLNHYTGNDVRGIWSFHRTAPRSHAEDHEQNHDGDVGAGRAGTGGNRSHKSSTKRKEGDTTQGKTISA